MKKTNKKLRSFVSEKLQAKSPRLFAIIAFLAIIGFGFNACCGGDDNGGGTGGNCNASCHAIGATGPGGGKIIYHNHSGFIVTGSFIIAYYLEAAPVNQATNVTWSSTNVDVTGATGTAIGTGKANTAAIIAAHPDDTASNNAAKAAAEYTGGGKNDWFLPSKDELFAMGKARTYLGISSEIFWSSSQEYIDQAWTKYLDGTYGKSFELDIRAVRAF